MNNWNFDLTQAPRDKPVWLATKCKKVLRSYYVRKTVCDPERWAGLGTKEAPIAWQPYIVPEHPFAAATQGEAAATAPTNVSLPVDERSGERANAGGDNVTGVENAHQISAGELVSNSSAPILHKHMFLDDVGGGA